MEIVSAEVGITRAAGMVVATRAAEGMAETVEVGIKTTRVAAMNEEEVSKVDLGPVDTIKAMEEAELLQMELDSVSHFKQASTTSWAPEVGMHSLEAGRTEMDSIRKKLSKKKKNVRAQKDLAINMQAKSEDSKITTRIWLILVRFLK